MTNIDIALLSALIALAGVIISIISAVFIAGRWQGTVNARLSALESKVNEAATKADLQAVRETLAEIKGMFRYTLKDGAATP